VSEGGAGFSAQWELGFPGVLREALRTNDPAQINLTGICAELGKRFNHDAFQRIIYTDSHDSAANGSARLNEVIALGKAGSLFARKQSLLAAVLLLTAPGIPMLFQGQEFMEGGSFNDWQGLDWNNAIRYASIIEAYRHLIALRRNVHGVSAGLLSGAVDLLHLDESNKVLAYHRWQNGGPKDDVMVVINFGNKAFEEYVLSFPRTGTWRVRFNSTWKGYSTDFKDAAVPDVLVETGGGTLVLPAGSAIILSQDD
jgi:1,4-alpha-glucan branching enzyme